MKRESFVFYRSFYEALEKLPEKDFNRMLRIVLSYALDGEVGEMNVFEEVVFGLIRPQIDTNNKRFEDGCKGAEYGQRGGRPKKPQQNPTETPLKPQQNPTKTPLKPHRNPTKTPNENENVNVNVNENVNVNKEKVLKKKGDVIERGLEEFDREFGGEVC